MCITEELSKWHLGHMTHFKKNKSRIKQISIETNKQCMHNGKGMWPLKKKKDCFYKVSELTWVIIFCYKGVTIGHI